MNKIIKDACVLFAITLVAGVLLGLVYQVTKDPIAKQNEKAKQAAYQQVMGTGEDAIDVDSFEAIEGEAEYDSAEASNNKYIGVSIESDSEDFSANEVTDAAAAVKDGKIVGFVAVVVAHDGYGGDIKFAVGMSSDGVYKGTSILSISETAGLGMRAKTDPAFLKQYTEKKVDKFTVVKDNTGSTADDKIDSISGSTITSKAVTKGINAGIATINKMMSDNVKTVGGASVE